MLAVVQNHLTLTDSPKLPLGHIVAKNIHATGSSYSKPNNEGIRIESESTGLSFLPTQFKPQARGG